ncbi:Gfo/Idh/MocA family oxidoreductase [Plantactinospora mayteni]|uniref:Oxidoreductase n=1 Tax=Plantactinospora mayteni TaxID=566021 RepID=A0ABQ4EFL9_9ACTN|nr:Gfo/Idh/MocA family oxidoreductase [Plantactinospora mayteni]GIG93520.1 oxidoreductase [Plantactinospora mayteni]
MKVGLVGVGRWGRKLLRVLSELEGITPVSVTRDGRDATVSLAEVLGDTGIGAVVVATPTATHQEVVGRCLAAGKHVLAEKPLCTSTRAARELARTAHARALVLRTGHTFLHHPAFAALTAEVATQSPTSIRASWRRPVPLDHDPGWELLPHPVSIVHRLAGGPPEVVRPRPWTDGHRAELRWETGLCATVQASRLGVPRWVVEIDTRSGARFEWTAESLRRRTGAGWQTVPHGTDEALRRELSEFVRAVRAGDRTDVVPGADVVATVEAVVAPGRRAAPVAGLPIGTGRGPRGPRPATTRTMRG